MKKIFQLVLPSMFIALFTGSPPLAAETGVVAQMFACNFNPGMDRTDLLEARDFALLQNEKIGSEDLNAMQSFFWWPLSSYTNYDYFWFDIYQNFNAFGRATDSYWRSEHSALAEARWSEVGSCKSSLHLQEEVFNGGEQNFTDPTALVEAYSCTLRSGKSVTDAEEITAEWTQQMRAAGTHKTMVSYLITPLLSDAPFDVFQFNVHDGVAEMASTVTTYLASDYSSDIDSGFNEVMQCDASLWNAQQVMGPPL